jgi:RNA polymerase sigma-70 factor (ECF subfamily)
MDVDEKVENATREELRAFFEDHWRRVKSRAHAHALMLTRNPADAEDLLQTSALRAWAGFGSFDRERSFAKWISTIMMRAHLDRRRLEKRRIRAISYESTPYTADGDSYLMEFPDTGPLLEDRVVERESHGDLDAALDCIPENHRSVVLMCDLLGLDYTDCAGRLGVPVGTVRSRLFRGRRKLRALLTSP